MDHCLAEWWRGRSAALARRARSRETPPWRSQKRHPAVTLPKLDNAAIPQILRLPLRIVIIRASQINGRPDVPILHQVRAILRHHVPRPEHCSRNREARGKFPTRRNIAATTGLAPIRRAHRTAMLPQRRDGKAFMARLRESRAPITMTRGDRGMGHRPRWPSSLLQNTDARGVRSHAHRDG